MPKLKTRKAAKKRYKPIRNRRYMRRRAFKGHLLEKKSSKQKRKLTGAISVNSSDIANIRKMVIY